MGQPRDVSNTLVFERAKPSGARVLIVEDEMLIAMTLVDLVEALGASPVTAARVKKALALLADETFDAAIVDMNLSNEPADAVLDALRARGIPFVITTGYATEAVAEKYRSSPMLAKPYTAEDVEAALLSLFASSTPRAQSG
jgi:ActR/RegA family two-component response regulator